jgi:hypothetical protein
VGGIRMRKEIIMVVAAFFLMSLTAITGAFAAEENKKIVTISETEADISGDGLNETISLKGVPYQNGDSYLKEIYIEVTAPSRKNVKIRLEGGSKASLKLVDLNHDGVKDLFANVLTGGSGGITINYLYTLKGFSLQNLSIPEPVEAESRFLNEYKAEVLLKPTGKTYLFDLKDRKTYYNKLGLFRKGRLNEPTELTVNPYNSLVPVTIGEGQVGLAGIQRVTGIANADTIAYIKSYWLYQDGKWKFVKAIVQKEGETA